MMTHFEVVCDDGKSNHNMTRTTISPSPVILKDEGNDVILQSRYTPDTISLASSLGVDAQERRQMKIIVDGALRSRSSHKLLKILSFQIIPLVALIVMCCILLSQQAIVHTNARLLRSVVLNNDRIDRLVVSLQVERGLSATFLSSNHSQHNVFNELQVARRDTDSAFSEIMNWPDKLNVPGVGVFFEKRSLQRVLWTHQEKVDRRETGTTYATNIAFYTSINVELIKTTVVESRKLSANVWHQIVAKENLLLAADFYGIERALGSVFYVRCSLEYDILQWFKTVRTEGDLMLRQAFNYDEDLQVEYNKLLYLTNNAHVDVDIMRAEIGDNKDACATYSPGQVEDRSLQWFKNSTILINILALVRGNLSEHLSQYVDDVIHNTKSQITLFSLTGFLTIIACVILSLFQAINSHNLISSIGQYAKNLDEKKTDLATEQKKTKRLLYQMIPKSVAKQLQAAKSVEAKLFKAVTIYFSDIEGFTAMSAQSSPMEVVDLLNNLYSTCDSCIDKYDVYKVETVGDAYMVVSGVPDPTDRHAWEIAAMALELLRVTETLDVPHLPGEYIKLRIGIHTGPCAAGVVGIKMPRYCLFGDTVNTASRMESTGTAKKIHISEATKEALGCDCNRGSVITVSRGEIDVKGKGTMNTYWLEGILEPTGRKRQVVWANSNELEDGTTLAVPNQTFGTERSHSFVDFDGKTLSHNRRNTFTSCDI